MEIFCVENDNRQSNDQSNRQLNDQSGVDHGNMIDDDAENLLHKAEQCDDANQILWSPVHQRMPPAHPAEYDLDWQLYIGHALLGSNPFLFGLSAVMNEDWTCRVSGTTLKSHSQLYRHSLSVQTPDCVCIVTMWKIGCTPCDCILPASILLLVWLQMNRSCYIMWRMICACYTCLTPTPKLRKNMSQKLKMLSTI